jgi:pyridoxine/pyridoxamine 5'-phosphate oxidase
MSTTHSRAEWLALLRSRRHAVQASVSPAGAPQAAIVGVAVSEELDVVFDTLATTRKCGNLRKEPRVAFVFGGDDVEWTVQLEGIADEPTGAELAAVKRLYFEKFPDGPTREAWPGITYVRVRPTWMRLSDYRGGQERIEEYPFDAPG